MTGVNVSTLLINIAVIEYAYNIPGLFRLINSAVRAPADVPVLEALVIEGVLLIVLANALADAFKPGSTRESGCALDVQRPAAQRDGAQRVPAEAVLAADVARQPADRDLVDQLDHRLGRAAGPAGA